MGTNDNAQRSVNQRSFVPSLSAGGTRADNEDPHKLQHPFVSYRMLKAQPTNTTLVTGINPPMASGSTTLHCLDQNQHAEYVG